MVRTSFSFLLPATLLLGSLTARAAGSVIDYDGEPIRYSSAEPVNAVSRLQESSGAGALEYDERFGWLPSILRELDVPASSQTLVFTKTSLQRHRISPRRPRALYFNDDVYVGYCDAGDVIEVSVADPQLGTVFYTVDQEKRERAEFTRQGDTCLICHGSSRNQGFPSHLLRSVYPDAGGQPIFTMGTHFVDQTTPFEDRWGGWYVTGTHGDATHLGNLIVRGKVQPGDVDNAAGQNVTDLTDRFDTSAYLQPHSDIAALLVLEHQTEMHNRITQLSFQTRLALWQEASMKKSLGDTDQTHYDSTVRRIQGAGDDLLEYMLFSGEAPLKAAVKGTSGFAEEFAAEGPCDNRGRSLRELDLQQRVFKHPCSYLIYSESFDALPDEGRDYVLERLWKILTGEDTDEKFAHLSTEDRRAILEILRDTKADLPDCWKSDRILSVEEQSDVTGD